MDPSIDLTRAPATPGGAPRGAETFTTGEILAGRYRIVGLLGEGGMGAVYRADDLTLGQPVALKFLPAAVERDPDRLERLVSEVRITRQISHPNVCRVYDLASAGSRHFLTMEYVDGEDVASLLRRIGRLPTDKALDIARQLCAGLAAAHDRGVIHRDLKPANIMLDGRGKVRITDFGLAVVAEGRADPRDRAGTPAYMAPEQIDGAPLTIQTDLYAVGLVLYEMLTGRRLLSSQSLDQLRRLQSDSNALRSSASDVHLDPAVERVVLRCVEHDAARRPASALAIAASLPGGDPLAAALSAGETPSPELVAAAGDDTSLPAMVVGALVVVAVAGCLVAGAVRARGSALAILRPPYSAEVLAVKAREMLQRLRPDLPVSGVASSFEEDPGFLRFAVDRGFLLRWRDLGAVRPSPVIFWQRTSPGTLAPRSFPGGVRVSRSDPPQSLEGMTLVATDVNGRLTYFDARPLARETNAPPASGPPWPQLFQEAGLDSSSFRPVDPEWLPPSWGDTRAAWIGGAAGATAEDGPLRVEAAAFRGRPTFFVVAAPWTVRTGAAPAPPRQGQRIGAIAGIAVLVAMCIVAAVMARTNIKAGRADRRGAARVAAFVGVTQLASAWLVMAHVPALGEAMLLLASVAWPLMAAAGAWILYIALEPTVRRSWPSALIGWNRLLDGRIRDARVAGDVLIGMAAGGFLYGALDSALYAMLPLPPQGLDAQSWLAAGSLRNTIAMLVNSVDSSLFLAFTLLLVFCVLRFALRRDTIAAIAFALLFTVLTLLSLGAAATSGGEFRTAFVIGYGLSYGAAFVVVLVRCGLVAVMACFVSGSLLSFVMTLDPSGPYSGPSFFGLVTVVLIAIAAAWTCRAAHRLGVRASIARPSFESTS